ncbi:MAG: S-layer homology domain-containing protein [Oscillospiraceae bacterium]|nr:S-layer homology domain-containing protein [Oscillospiraceae bacterium]
MNRTIKSCLSLLMALCILMSLSPMVFAADNLFTDVKATDWYYSSVLWAKEQGITSGKGEMNFAPNEGCTRAQVVTFLWAANGRPLPLRKCNPFGDVSPDAWYATAVLWAVEKGITSGTSSDTFSPDAECTRAQIVTFLYAAVGKPKVTGVSRFADVADTDWYARPVTWAMENKVTSGIGNGNFGPDNICTRAQVVTFLYKVYGTPPTIKPIITLPPRPTIRPVPTPIPSFIPVPVPITPKPIIK